MNLTERIRIAYALALLLEIAAGEKHDPAELKQLAKDLRTAHEEPSAGYLDAGLWNPKP